MIGFEENVVLSLGPHPVTVKARQENQRRNAAAVRAVIPGPKLEPGSGAASF